MYIDLANEKLNKLRERDDFLILAIESSCDETAVAVTRGREVLSNIIASQIEIHKRYGGVVPEIASRNHTLAIRNVVSEALEEAKVSLDEIDAIAVTYGAGLLGALLIGVSFAKSLAFSKKLPLIGVNHIHGHISANYIMHKDLEPPYLCLVASGGHSALVKVKDYNDLEVIGSTQDDACGEAFDKVARVLDLPYPGGPMIEKLAKEGKNVIPMPHPYKNQKHFNFSYSGLKTAVINYVHSAEQRGEELNKSDVAASFQSAAIDMLVENAVRAAKIFKIDKVAIAGGVGANGYLRESMDRAGEKNNFKVYYPSLKLCTDNAAMIGCCAYYMIKGGCMASGLSLDADASLKIQD